MQLACLSRNSRNPIGNVHIDIAEVPLLAKSCGRTRDGRFNVKHQKQSSRLTRKLTAICQDATKLAMPSRLAV